MKTLSAIFVATLFMFAVMTGPVMAQQNQQTDQTTTTDQTMDQQQDQQKPLASAGMHKASDLMDKSIKSQQGEEIGSINDIIIDDQGKVSYIIISRGGTLGIGGDTVPVPWEAANLQMQQDELVSSLDKQKLENAPTLEGDQYSKITEPGFEQAVHSYYGTQQQNGVKSPKMHSPGMMDQKKDGFTQTPGTETPGQGSEQKKY